MIFLKLEHGRLTLEEEGILVRNTQEFYPTAAFVLWAVSICFVIFYYG